MRNDPLDVLRLLSAATAQAFELMCFTVVEPADAPVTFEGAIAGRVSFSGDAEGELLLQMDMDTARSSAANFLGAFDADLCEGQIGEVISELANVICGSVLTSASPGGAFRLTKPQIAFGMEQQPLNIRQGFYCESGRIVASFQSRNAQVTAA